MALGVSTLMIGRSFLIALKAENDVIIEVDGGLGLGAGVMFVGRRQVLVSQDLADDLVMPGLGIEQQLGRNMPELVWCELNGCMIPTSSCDLTLQGRMVFGVAVSAWE